jgi:hypothetical protein
MHLANQTRLVPLAPLIFDEINAARSGMVATKM